MKKFICGLILLVLVLSSVAVTVSAYQIGDRVGDVVYTDISAYINHYPIASYAYDGGTVIIVEDLVNYGFDVSYDNDTRSLSIFPNRSKTILSGMGTVYKNGNRLGQYYSDALYSDINVYFNGSWIPSCAINGYMMVKLEDLASETAGTSFTWDNSTRSAKLWLDWASIIEYKALSERNASDYEKYLGYYFNPISEDRFWFGYELTISEINGNYIDFNFQYQKAGHAVNFSADRGYFTSGTEAVAYGSWNYGDVPEGSGGFVKYVFSFNYDIINLKVYIDSDSEPAYDLIYYAADTIDPEEAEILANA